MTTFEIKDRFYLDGQPFQIISGTIHYFRVIPEYWRDRLEKLKLLGCNTVETYVPWNIHEPEENHFSFSGIADLRQFLRIAQELELYVILRPSPYICAEWEFGGLPYWLLKDPLMKIRMNEARYMAKVAKYFARLFPEVVDLQIDYGGPIILMQVENEYGGYANDQSYLENLVELMRSNGVTVPLITSDGPWRGMLANGSIPQYALPTINCGSDVKNHFRYLRDFHGKVQPLMVTEFWIGWFDAWNDEKHHVTDVKAASKELADILSEGSVNIYVFHGGTNFGFMNGANDYGKLAPDVTSYDYDALLTEWGDTTPKYHAFQEIIGQIYPLPKFELSTKIMKKYYGQVSVTRRVSLFETLDQLSTSISTIYPQSMEMYNQGYGYIYYQSQLMHEGEIEDFRLIQCKDRAQVFINQKHLVTQYDREIGENYPFKLEGTNQQLGILVENMGRVNYSVQMNHQQKGIIDGVIINGSFQTNWQVYCLPLNNLEDIDFTQQYIPGQPSFSSFIFDIEECGDTFVDLTGWGKGVVFINGFHLGRFWEVGPQKRLYLPGPLLRKGQNEIIIFETEGMVRDNITLTDQPDLG